MGVLLETGLWLPPMNCCSCPFLSRQVWDLSDIDKDGHLDRGEFAVVRRPGAGEGGPGVLGKYQALW